MFLAVSSFFSLMLILGNVLVAFSCFTKLNVFFISCISFAFSLFVFFKNLNHTKFSYYSLSLLIITFFIYSNYSPISLGGQDPGVYVSFAGTLANKGTYQDSYHQIRIGKKNKKILFEESNKKEPNFNGITKNNKNYKSTFLISPSILLAENFLFFSRSFSFFINTIFCILAAFAFFYFCLEIFDKKTSLALTLLLCFCPAQIHFGKAPYSEIPAQFFVFTSLLSLIYFKREYDDKEIKFSVKYFLFVILTSLFLASASLYRPELYILLFLTIFLLPLIKETPSKNEKKNLIFFQAFLVLFFLLIDCLNLKTGWNYINRVSKQEAFYVKNAFIYALFFFICSLGFYTNIVRKFLNASYLWIKKNLNKEIIFCILALGIILFLAGGYVYRIMFLGLHQHYWKSAGRVIETMNEMIFHRVSVLTGVPIFIASFFGIFLFIKDKTYYHISFYILLLLYFAYASKLLLFQSNSPQLYWAVRRYLPCMVPTIIFLGAYAICNFSFFKNNINNFIFAIGLYLISLLPMFYLSFPLIKHSEMDGALKFTETIEKNLDKESSVFIGDFKDKNFLQQLKFLGGYDVYMIPNLIKDGKISEEKAASLKNIERKLKRKKLTAYYIFLNDSINDKAFKKKLEFKFNHKRIGEDKINYPQTIYNIRKNVIIGNFAN